MTFWLVILLVWFLYHRLKPEKPRSPVDTSTLVVGQEVSMSCEYFVSKGEMVKVTPEGVLFRRKSSGELIRFGSNGEG